MSWDSFRNSKKNRILPWDNDIDIGVWAHEVSKNDIIKIFKSLGFP